MPKFGQLVDTDVWEATARTLTDFSAEEIFDIPLVDDEYASLIPISSATANTFGSSVEISSDVGEGKRLLYVTFTEVGGAEMENLMLEFGDAADGAGNVVARLHSPNCGITGGYVIPLFKSLADNSALHVRVKDEQSWAISYGIGVQIA